VIASGSRNEQSGGGVKRRVAKRSTMGTVRTENVHFTVRDPPFSDWMAPGNRTRGDEIVGRGCSESKNMAI
jgi:hypothetical protein